MSENRNNLKPKKRQKRVILFTGPGCVWCVKAKNFFKKNKIKFNEIDVTKIEKRPKIVKNTQGVVEYRLF